MKIFVAGAGGFIGRHLVEKLAQNEQNEIIALTRKKTHFSHAKNIIADIREDNHWQSEVETCDVVVNLCGNDIAKKWTPSVKKELEGARVTTTKQIVEAMSNETCLINASAVGYYGYSLHKTFDEQSANGRDFLAKLAASWEQQAMLAQQKQCRVVIMRLGVTLGNGGAIKNMLGQKFLGGKIGSGKQFFSWIHIEDVLQFVEKSIRDTSFEGIYNVCSPNPVNYTEFNKALTALVPKIATIKIPNMLLKMTLGEFAETILQGQKVLPVKLQKSGFHFLYPDLKVALQDILSKSQL